MNQLNANNLMNAPHTRREFFAEVGRGMLIASVGYEVANGLGLASALEDNSADELSFGSLEPLVSCHAG